MWDIESLNDSVDHIRISLNGETVMILQGGMAALVGMTFHNLLKQDEARAADYISGFCGGIHHCIITGVPVVGQFVPGALDPKTVVSRDTTPDEDQEEMNFTEEVEEEGPKDRVPHQIARDTRFKKHPASCNVHSNKDRYISALCDCGTEKLSVQHRKDCSIFHTGGIEGGTCNCGATKR